MGTACTTSITSTCRQHWSRHSQRAIIDSPFGPLDLIVKPRARLAAMCQNTETFPLNLTDRRLKSEMKMGGSRPNQTRADTDASWFHRNLSFDWLRNESLSILPLATMFGRTFLAKLNLPLVACRFCMVLSAGPRRPGAVSCVK